MPNTLFIAVGHYGQRITSVDGSKWENLQAGKEGQVYRSVKFGNGRVVAAGTFGGKNLFATSGDGGKTWQETEKEGNYSRYVHGLGFGGDTFVAVGGDPGSVGASSPFAALSKDGVAWGDYLPMNERVPVLRRLAYGKGPGGEMIFVGVGDRGRRASSKDGKTWVEVEKTKAIDTLVDITYGEPGGKGLFVGVGLHGLRLTSADGVAWSERMAGEEGEHLNSIVWTGEGFVAVGMGATYVSTDGAKWDRKPNKDAPLTVAYGNSIYVGTNWKGRILMSKDAIEWTQVHRCDEHLESVALASLTTDERR